MKKYNVRLVYLVTKEANLEIDAIDEEDALQKAEAIAPFQDEETDRSLETSEVEEQD